MCILKKFKMDSFEINKIIAAVLVTVLIVFGVGKISDIIFHVKDPKVQGYKVEVKLASSSGKESSSESQVDIAALLSIGNIEHGKKVFKKCAACHSINKDGKNKIGPKLWGVMFRPVGSITEYKYSKALSEYKKEWSWEEMNGFLIKPKDWIKGTKMAFAGLKKAEDRAAVILYMNENTNSPLSLQ